MRLEEVQPGQTVFWAGVTWAAGTMVAFVRRGVIVAAAGDRITVEEGTGKRFAKARHRLTTCEATARSIAEKLSEPRRGNLPPRPGCNKTIYPDKRAALTSLHRAERRRRNPAAGKLRAYQCEDCRGWHLTRQPAEERADAASAARPHRGQPAGISPDGKIQTAETL